MTPRHQVTDALLAAGAAMERKTIVALLRTAADDLEAKHRGSVAAALREVAGFIESGAHLAEADR